MIARQIACKIARPSRALLGLAAALTAGCGEAEPAQAPTTCALDAPALPSTHLHADGTLLRDELGRTVFLRGVNAGGHSKLPPFSPFDYAEGDYQKALDTYLDRAASWGIDVLRVPFTWEAIEPVEGMDDEAFLQRYDALLDGAFARGMLTVVDFHQDIYARIYCGDGFPAWTVPGPHPEPHHDCPTWGTKYLDDKEVHAAFDAFWADGSKVQEAYAKLWERLAMRYRDRPGVIGFELFNEPGWGSADLDTWEATTLTMFYTSMAARIRKVAPDTLIFFDPPGVDAVFAQTSMARPEGEGLVFAPHYYQAGALTGAGGDPDLVEPKVKVWAGYGKKWQLPVFLGEFGEPAAFDGAEDFLRAHYDAFDATGVHGTAWEYSVTEEVWNAELLSVVDAKGDELPVAKALIRPFARAVAGTDIESAFDAKAGKLTLRFTPSPVATVSELSVPERAFPSGYDVAISGGCYDKSKPGRVLVRANEGAGEVSITLGRR
ncbi:MAG: cellulase family glycosylhydrolase [Byssovorax sp.]